MSIKLDFIGRDIPLYGLLFAIGIICAALVAAVIKKKRDIGGFDLVGSAVFTMIFALVGAKLLSFITAFDYYWTVICLDNLSLLTKLTYIIGEGFVFYGGLIGGFFGLLLYIRIYKLKIFDFLDVYATVLPLGHAFGRVGCFFGGCCYGIPYDGPLAHTYHEHTITPGSDTPIEIPLFPVQLVEATCLALIFVALMFVFFKTERSKHLSVFVYAASYCVVRFVLEFFRGDKVRGVALLSTSQWISLAIALFAAGYIVYTKFIKKPAPAEAASDEAPATEAEPAEEKTEA